MTRGLGDQLEKALSRRDLALLRLVAREAHSLGLALYMVGGFPRDLVLGRAPTDFDLVVEGSAIQLANRLAAKYGGRTTVHRRFGTAKWHLDRTATPGWPGGASTGRRHADVHLDLISARSEVYPRPAQLPHIRLGTIAEDLQRRDFTINTLAIRLDGKHFGTVLDPLGALDDVERGAIRVLHDRSFRDDPTRMYRAVRYEKRLGFKITPETLRLTATARRWVGQLSAHRIRQELDQILGEDQAAAMLSRLGRLGLLSAVHRALPDDNRALRRLRIEEQGRSDAADTRGNARGRTKQWLLWLMDLTPVQIASVRRRLRFDNRLTAELVAASELRRNIRRLIRLRPSRLTQHLRNLPLDAVETVHGALPPGKPRRVLAEYLTNWRHIRPRATGIDLRALGIPPGPAYRSILQ
ncbi:MAG: hypothetical protein V1755_04385, partial [Chloroflexota bacterium]